MKEVHEGHCGLCRRFGNGEWECFRCEAVESGSPSAFTPHHGLIGFPGELPASPPIAVDPTNPKDAIGATKPATWSVVPRWITFAIGRVMQIGGAKYGAFNYREAPVRASIYLEAMERHAALWTDGEDMDDETGESHLSSVMANCAILMDAQRNGTLIDDRAKTGFVRKVIDGVQALINRDRMKLA